MDVRVEAEMTEQTEPTKCCPTCGEIKPHTELLEGGGWSVCNDDWHRQPAAPETAEPSTLISDSRIKHSPLFCGSRYCAQHRDIWHHFETVISRDSAAPPEGEANVEVAKGNMGTLPDVPDSRTVQAAAVASPAMSAEQFYNSRGTLFFVVDEQTQAAIFRFAEAYAAALTECKAVRAALASTTPQPGQEGKKP